MKRWLAVLGGGGVVVFALVAATRPGRSNQALDVLVVYLGGLALGALALRLSRVAPPAGRSAIETVLRAPGSPSRRPADLARIERQVGLGVAHAVDLHASLAPLLRSIALPLLALHGVDPEREPERAGELIGPWGWQLIRPDAPFPQRPLDPGMPAATLDELLARLERLAA